MLKLSVFFLLIVSLLPGQSIDYRPDYSHPDASLQWDRGSISLGVVGFSVAAIYNAGRPIYYNEAKRDFHFTRNPNGDLEWFDNGHRGLDKFGHIYSAGLFAQNIRFLARWSGMGPEASSWTAFGLATGIMSAMEIHDAYYVRWGFTPGDFVANAIGAGFTSLQYHYPKWRAFDYKLGYNFTRPKSDEATIEDYTNMTFWLTFNAPAYFDREIAWWPNWLNVATGVSVSRGNRRELVVALDYNLKRIKTDSPFLRHLIVLLDRYKLPAPGLRITPDFIGYGLYF